MSKTKTVSIKEFCASHGISQSQLAQFLEIDTTTIERYIAGTRKTPVWFWRLLEHLEANELKR